MMSCAEVTELLGLKVGCCNCCHEDYDEYGYDLLCETEVRGQAAYVCCAVRLAVRDVEGR